MQGVSLPPVPAPVQPSVNPAPAELPVIPSPPVESRSGDSRLLTKLGLIFFVLAFLALIGSLVKDFISRRDQAVCTLEAKVCPDGTNVGRMPPDCEFAPCPSFTPVVPTVTPESSVFATPSGTLFATPSASPQ
jgi:hypothetical protein